MIRGFVYSILAICVFFLGIIAYIIFSGMEESASYSVGGWMLLVAFFFVGPVFFGIGYWHNRRLHPDAPHWDPETGE